MARGEFITDLWDLDSAHFDFDKPLFLLICSKDNLIDIPFFRVFQWNRLVFESFLVAESSLIVLILINVVLEGGDDFTNNYVVSTHLSAWADQSICV